MEIKIDIKTFGGSVLFTYEAENNTVKKTLEEAVNKGADLAGAYLIGAYLRGADLRGVNLIGADLIGAYLRGADLRGINLIGADLRGVNLGDDITKFPISYVNLASRDMLFIFQSLKNELPSFREKLLRGEIDGSQYEGDCACLVGTMGKLDGGVNKVCQTIPFYDKGVHNPGEAWFLNIHPGDTPDNNVYAKHVLKLIDMVIGEERGEV